MHFNVKRLGVGLWLVPLLASSLAAAGSDLRLMNAVERQDKQAVRALLKEGVDVNASRADGATALQWAAHWDDLDTADLLLRAGAAVNAANDHGVSPLALACENGSAAMVEKLLKAGANANAMQHNGETALMTAARTGSVNVVKALLLHGASVNSATNQIGQTALMWAVSEHHLDVVRALVERGADVHARSKRGFTPLLFAARLGDIEAATLLLAAGAGVNETAADGTHPLLMAINSGQPAFALFLLQNGADPNATTAGNSALHAAIAVGSRFLRGGAFQASEIDMRQDLRVTLVKDLLARGADPNTRITTYGDEGRLGLGRHNAFNPYSGGLGSLRYATPFWLAAQNANVELMRLLLTAGADPLLRTEDQTTPLMVASGIGRGSVARDLGPVDRALEAVKFLVEETSADVNAVNEAGLTALHATAFAGADGIARYLVEHGANIDKQDFRGRPPFRIAQGHKAAFAFRENPKTAELLKAMGADTSLGVDGHIAEGDVRDVDKVDVKQQQR